MWRYYELLSEQPVAEVARLRADCDSGALNPKVAKVRFAAEIVTRFHSASDARDAEARWQAQFSQGQVPEDMPEFTLPAEDGGLWLPRAMALASLCKSNSDGRRLIDAGAVQVDGQKVSDVKASLAAGGDYVVKAGKRAWARISIR
jgi:tyrosyl-tRNA synthetase